MSKIREEAERIANGDGVIDFAHAQIQAERVLILLDALEDVQKHVVGMGISEAIKKAEGV